MATVTFSPASAQPQKVEGLPDWRTMWSLRILGSLTSACAEGRAEALKRSAARGRR